MLPRERGRYFATPLSWAVDQYEGRPVFDVSFLLGHIWSDGQWQQVENGLTIGKRFFLMKKDNTWSGHLDMIREALNWTGNSLTSLASGDWSQTPVQLTIDYEKSDKDNKEYIGVIFIHPEKSDPNAIGRQLTNDPQTVQNLDAKYGPMLRAKYGAAGPKTNGHAPAKPAPTTPQAAKTPQTAKASAWAEFQAKTPQMDKDARTAKWAETVKGYGPPNKASKDFTINDWEVVANSIAEYGAWTPPPAPEQAPEGEAVPAGGPPDDGVPAVDDLPF